MSRREPEFEFFSFVIGLCIVIVVLGFGVKLGFLLFDSPTTTTQAEVTSDRPACVPSLKVGDIKTMVMTQQKVQIYKIFPKVAKDNGMCWYGAYIWSTENKVSEIQIYEFEVE